MVRCSRNGRRRRLPCARSDAPVFGRAKSHFRAKPLQQPDRPAACIDVHVKHRRMKRVRQSSDTRLGKVMIAENPPCLRAAQNSHIRRINPTITVQIKSETAKCMDRDTKICRTSGIGGIIHKPALPGQDRICN